ncbi:unnamed protein product [Schistosoma turkestanicum]|nr:unnamed protein product [Schistosoma turkestanicum]
MSGTVVASYECLTSPFLDIVSCRSFDESSECNESHVSQISDAGKLFISNDCISNGTTDTFYPKTDQSFDEEVKIIDVEEVETPRTASPTLNDLKKRLAAASVSPRFTQTPPIFDRKKINNPLHQKFLSEVASKPCLYPLERLFDEYIPVRSRIRPLKGKLGLTSEVPSGDQNNRITFRSVSSKNSLHLLEHTPICSLPSPLLRQTYSSSGSLISNLTDLSFNNDAILSIPLTTGLHVSELLSGDIILPKDESAFDQIANSSINSSESSHSTDKLACEPISIDISDRKEVTKSIFSSNPDLSENQHTDPNSHIYPSEQYSSFYIQSYNSGCLKEKNHARTKRSETKKSLIKTVNSKNSDLSCTEVKMPVSDSNTVNENVKPHFNDLDKLDPFDEPLSEIDCLSSLNTLEKSSNRRVLFSDCDKVSGSVATNLSTHSDLCNISSFPISYMNEEPKVVEEDFTPVTNKRLRRKQQQHSKLVQSKACNFEQSSNDFIAKTYSHLPTQPVNNGSTFIQHHVTRRPSANVSKRSVQRGGMYSNAHEKCQSSSARSATSLPNPQDTVSRKLSNTDNISSSKSSNLTNHKPASTPYSHSANRDLTSQKSVHTNPYLNSSLRYSQVLKKPFSNSNSVILSSDVQGTLPAITTGTVSPVQYEMLKQFMISAWKSFMKS